MSERIEVLNVLKRYGEHSAVNDVSFTVEPGEFFTLLGASGSGKSTTLMMIAGFVQPDIGDIRIGGRPILSLPPERRDVGVVFQSYALFPHMTVAQNIGFPLRMRGVGKAARAGKVTRALELVNLGGMGERRVTELSGGQQQRVALARALVFEPKVLLMDEPLGALDRGMREQMQIEFKRLQQVVGVTLVYVTHDQEEALALSDRMAVMVDGRIEQVGTPAEIYETPKSLFVGKFLGESNELEATITERRDSSATLALKGSAVRFDAHCEAGGEGQAVNVLVRPEAMQILPVGTVNASALPGRIFEISYLGRSLKYGVTTDAGNLTVTQPRINGIGTHQIGDAVKLCWSERDAVCFVAERR